MRICLSKDPQKRSREVAAATNIAVDELPSPLVKVLLEYTGQLVPVPPRMPFARAPCARALLVCLVLMRTPIHRH